MLWRTSISGPCSESGPETLSEGRSPPSATRAARCRGGGTQPARWCLAFPNPLLHLSYQPPERCGLLLPSTAGTGLDRAGWAPPGRALPFTGTGWAGPFALLGRAEPGPGVTAAAGLPVAFLGGKPRAEVGGFVVRVPKAMADRSPPGEGVTGQRSTGDTCQDFFFFLGILFYSCFRTPCRCRSYACTARAGVSERGKVLPLRGEKWWKMGTKC